MSVVKGLLRMLCGCSCHRFYITIIIIDYMTNIIYSVKHVFQDGKEVAHEGDTRAGGAQP